MKIRHILGIALLAISTAVGAQSSNPNTKWHWEKGTIVVDTPTRPAGQENALQMAAPKIQTVRVGFCGLGARGPWAVNRYCHIPGVQIVALCDYEPKRVEAAQKILKKAGLPEAASYSGEKGYEELCKRSALACIRNTRIFPSSLLKALRPSKASWP